MSPYEALGVRPGASPAEVRAAWRRMARTAHPDVGGDADAFRRAAAAYRYLTRGGRRPAVITVAPHLGPTGLALRWFRRRRRRRTHPRVT